MLFLGMEAWSQSTAPLTPEEKEMVMYWDILENWDLLMEEFDDPEFLEDWDFEGEDDENQG